MKKSNPMIAHLGLCAAAAIFVASLGILVFQGSESDGVPMRSLQPAQIQSGPVLGHSTPNASESTGQSRQSGTSRADSGNSPALAERL